MGTVSERRRTLFGCALTALLLLSMVNEVRAEIISLSVGAGSVAILGASMGLYSYVKCKFYECCDEPWIKKNVAQHLQREVQEKLYGQHIAQETVSRAVRAHIAKANPSKALVMSFHGWTGSGKNYLAKMVARSVFKRKMNSDFIHLFVSTLHFPHQEEVEKYKEQLQSWIVGNLTKCERSMFIFDEMDKMPAQLLDAILPFIDFHDKISGVDPRKAIFLFLSNAGSKAIAERAMEHHNEGRPRENLTFGEMEQLIKTNAYNEGEGGLRESKLISRHMIDYFVPFLPMERRHVLMCFKQYIKEKGIEVGAEQVEELTDSLQYFPKDRPIYSVAGCRPVEQKVDFVFADHPRRGELEHQRDDL